MAMEFDSLRALWECITVSGLIILRDGVKGG